MKNNINNILVAYLAFKNLLKDISTPKATFKNTVCTVGCEKALCFGKILKCHSEAVCERRRESEEERERM